MLPLDTIFKLLFFTYYFILFYYILFYAQEHFNSSRGPFRDGPNRKRCMTFVNKASCSHFQIDTLTNDTRKWQRDSKMSKVQIFKDFVSQRLAVATQDILAAVEGIVAGYEEEASFLREQIDRQRKQLEPLQQPRVQLNLAG